MREGSCFSCPPGSPVSSHCPGRRCREAAGASRIKFCCRYRPNKCVWAVVLLFRWGIIHPDWNKDFLSGSFNVQHLNESILSWERLINNLLIGKSCASVRLCFPRLLVQMWNKCVYLTISEVAIIKRCKAKLVSRRKMVLLLICCHFNTT